MRLAAFSSLLCRISDVHELADGTARDIFIRKVGHVSYDLNISAYSTFSVWNNLSR